MKLLTKKWVVYLLITMMAVPTIFLASIAGAKPAMAATNVSTETATGVNTTDLALPTDSTTPTVSPIIESTATPTVAETPTITPEPTTPEPTPAPSPSSWTFEKVELNKEYIAPQNSEVKLTFTKLPDPSGNIKIEQISLTEDQIKQTGSLSDKAYDITSDMVDGTFEYALTLPKPVDQENVQIKFAENIAGLENADTVASNDVTTETDSVSATLDHFTIFVVVNPLPIDGPACIAAGADTGTGCYATIQEAVNAAAASGDTINVADGIYNLTSRINVNKAVSIIGNTTTPSNVEINAPTGGTLQGQNSVFVITSSDVTIRGFRIQGALHGAGTVQNAGIYVNDPNLLSNPGLSNITISNNEVTNNGYGIFVENIKNSTISNNKIYSNKKVVGKESESGVGIVVYGRAEDSNHTHTLTIDNNQAYSNETEGIRVDVESAVGATKFVNDLAITISNNIVYNNGSTIGGVDKYVGIKSAGWSKGVTVSGNEIYGHTGTTISATSGNAGIWIAASNGWVVDNNNIHDNLNGIFFAYSIFDPGSGSHTISNNNIHANVRGISIDDGTEAVANNKNSIYSNNSTAFSGIGFAPYGVYNSGSGTFDATNNWWGNASGPYDNKTLPGTPNYKNPLGTGDSVTSYVDYKPWYTNAEMTTLNYMAPTFTTSAGQGKSINIKFSNVQPGTTEYDVYVNGKLYTIYFPTASTYNILVANYGAYSIYAVARYGSALSNHSATQTLTLSAPAAPVVKSSVGSSLTTPTSAQAATTAPASTTPGLDEQGQIKAAESTSSATESNKINWTPWIILFILILLAGAATGGYFYWFGGDSEASAATVAAGEKQAAAAPLKKGGANKPVAKGDKKSRRW